MYAHSLRRLKRNKMRKNWRRPKINKRYCIPSGFEKLPSTSYITSSKKPIVYKRAVEALMPCLPWAVWLPPNCIMKHLSVYRKSMTSRCGLPPSSLLRPMKNKMPSGKFLMKALNPRRWIAARKSFWARPLLTITQCLRPITALIAKRFKTITATLPSGWSIKKLICWLW